jgi:hypothetical protein
VNADLDTLAIALYVRADDRLKLEPERVPWHPAVGIAPRISNAELLAVTAMQALLGYVSEARWLRRANTLQTSRAAGASRDHGGDRPAIMT